eukprot:scaffold50374_cov63-Phaeocystis_antarctica.AAC.2
MYFSLSLSPLRACCGVERERDLGDLILSMKRSLFRVYHPRWTPQRACRAPISPRRPSMAAVCSSFLQGRCRNGDACRFSHDATIEGERAGAMLICALADL